MKLLSKSVSSTKKIELSRSYIDQNGDLVLFETRKEKIVRQFSLLFEELPPVAIFMVGMFFLTQLYIVFGGLYYHSTHQLQEGELKTYLFLFGFVGLAIGIILKLAWLFIEEREIQNYSKKHAHTDFDSY